MKDMILKMILEWLAKQLTAEQMQKWVDAAKAYVMPKLYLLKDELIAKGRELAKDTSSPVDDILVDKLAMFLDLVLPPQPPVHVPSHP